METAYNDLPLEVEIRLDMENELTVLRRRLEIETDLGFPVYRKDVIESDICLLYTSPSPRDRTRSRMPSSA